MNTLSNRAALLAVLGSTVAASALFASPAQAQQTCDVTGTGDPATAAGTDALACGPRADANGEGALAVGPDTSAQGNGTVPEPTANVP
ncbi:MAG: hypothetical protein AAFN48_09555, partial [Pseudomonadota bacterium]